MGGADLVLWLGDEPPVGSAETIWVHARADMSGREGLPSAKDIAVSHADRSSIDRLWAMIDRRVGSDLSPDTLPLRHAERETCRLACGAMMTCGDDPILIAEGFRSARRHLGTVIGVDATETLLDGIFSRFCLGK